MDRRSFAVERELSKESAALPSLCPLERARTAELIVVDAAQGGRPDGLSLASWLSGCKDRLVPGISGSEVVVASYSVLVTKHGGALGLTLLLAGCGSSALTQRYTEATTGYSQSYGAPQDQTFHADVAAAGPRLELTLFEQFKCNVMRVRNVHRTRETLDGDKVISKVDLGPSQIAQTTDETVPCDARVARDMQVSLRIGTATYLLGVTDSVGKLSVDLASVLRDSGMGTLAPLPDDGLLLVGGREAERISLAQYREYLDRFNGLLREFRTIVDQEDDAAVAKDFVRAYELYLTLRQLDQGDPRFEALEVRFLEHQFQRNLGEAAKSLKRNAQALAEARKLLGAAGVRDTVPEYVVLAVQNDAPSAAMLRWALGRVAESMRADVTLCGSQTQPFGWNGLLRSELAPTTRLAFELTHYGFGDDFQAQVRRVCAKIGRR